MTKQIKRHPNAPTGIWFWLECHPYVSIALMLVLWMLAGYIAP